MVVENITIQMHNNSRGNWMYQIISQYDGREEEEIIYQGTSDLTFRKTLKEAYEKALEVTTN